MYSYVLAFEVLDNLPHDCVVRHGSGGEWQEVTVELAPSGARQLGERPLQDSLIREVLAGAQWNKAGAGCSRVTAGRVPQRDSRFLGALLCALLPPLCNRLGPETTVPSIS